jgi:endonuclease YncB( thermonuclease family)
VVGAPRTSRKAAALVLFGALCAVAAYSQAAKYPFSIVGEVVGVTDGDTVKVLRDRRQYKIRLNGIDAPELKQAYGRKSKEYLAALVFQKKVEVVVRGMDRYGRYVGDVLIGGKSANAELVAVGLAWHYTAYSKDQNLAALERAARAKRLGLWADPGPVPPWQFRRKKTAKRQPVISSPR